MLILKDKAYIAKHLALPADARNMKVKSRIQVPSAAASSGHWSKNADGEWGFDLSDTPIESVSKLNICSDDDDDEPQANNNEQNTIYADNTNRKNINPNAVPAQSSKMSESTAQQQQGSRKNSESVSTTTNVIEQSSPPPIHLVLRMRDVGKDLQDIKFDFLPNKDTVDGISHELVNAKLIDTIDSVAVSANLTKLLENHSLSPITFPLVSFTYEKTLQK